MKHHYTITKNVKIFGTTEQFNYFKEFANKVEELNSRDLAVVEILYAMDKPDFEFFNEEIMFKIINDIYH